MKYKEIIDKMTLQQKAALMSGKDFWQSYDIPELGINSMFLADGPHGIRKQAAAADHLGLNASIPATCFPTAATMANTWNTELGEEMGKFLGEEAAAENVNVLLGPGMNIKRNPRCGRNFEYFSEDPYLAGKMAGSYVKGIQSNGVSACLKHFALNNQEERRMSMDTVVDERTMREIYLTAFEIAVKDAKPWTIMSSYNMVNGTHVNENFHLMRDILRDEWGYKGVVVTDWAGCNDRVQGVMAGNELEMPACLYGVMDIEEAVTNGYNIMPVNCTPDTPGQQYERVMAGLDSGEPGGKLKMELLDECVDNLLDLIFKTEKTFEGKDKNKTREFDVESHHAMAMKCAEEGMVLLRNENSTLPLAAGTKVAVIGDFARKPRYQGAGSSIVNPTKLDNTLEWLGFGVDTKTVTKISNENEFGFDIVGYAMGYNRYGKKKPAYISEACSLAKKADVALVYVGLDEVTEAEGLDRENIKIPQNQIDLIKKLKAQGSKVVAVLMCGSAVEIPFADDVDAMIHAYLCGQAGAKAILNIISGKVNPSGKLSESYPFAYEQCSSAPYFPGKQLTVEYREGPFIGYRYYDTAKIDVRYPFGFGLSYTTYEYSDLAVSDKGVSFKIKNTGAMDGKEVAQLYIGKPDSGIFRSAKELKGFKKVFVKAGETVKVEIPFDDYSFRYYNVKTLGWEIESGEYKIMIGASSTDIRLTGKLNQKGTDADVPYEKDALKSYYNCDVKSIGDDEFKALLASGDEKVKYPLPSPNYPFYKRKRMVIGYNSTVSDLRYSKRWAGRAFSGIMRFAVKFMRGVGNRSLANTMVMGVLHQPMRGMSKFGGMTRRQMDGLLTMWNGHLFKGLGMVMKGGKKLDKKEQENREATAEELDANNEIITHNNEIDD